FLRGVMEMAAPLARKNNNQLKSTVPEGLGEAFNDETRLRQVLLNLISNACKFTEKGTVTLEAERQPGTPPANLPSDDWAGKRTGDLLIFRVRDNGAGMTPTQMSELFKPFYRVDNSMSRKQGGTGLGLTITK